MKKRRPLSAAEQRLWRVATRHVNPLSHRETTIDANEQNHLDTLTPTTHPGPPKASKLSAPTTTRAKRIAAPSSPIHPLAAGDPALDKRAGRGRLPIDATLDLHGLTQAAAHHAVHRFIDNAYERGFRCLLIITGKGSNPTGSGILRAGFQNWITEASVRKKISRASQAQQHHGGQGAFYVFLKKKST